jgi:hypothetical protein
MKLRFYIPIKQFYKHKLLVGFLGVFLIVSGCQNDLPERPNGAYVNYSDPDPIPIVGENADIDLSNWKVTLPIPRSDGKPLEVSPPEVLNYATNEILKPFFYNDSLDGALVFYTYQGGATTTNSTYPRTELREQLVAGSNSTNWTFAEGGRMRGTLSVPEISKKSNGDYHRTIIMQIHGRLTDQQKGLIGASDNNAPPVLKIYWQNNKVYVRTKQLKDTSDTYQEMLHTDAWEDDNGRYFAREVGTDSFNLEVVASDGRLTVSLDNNETFVYDDIHMQKWGVFENYFKAGNYLGTTDQGSFSRVKYYNLEVKHD